MATIPSPSTQAASSVVTSTLLNNHRDALQFLLGSTMTGSGGGRRPLVRARLAVAQNLATSGTAAALLLDTEDLDYDAMHSTATNTNRFTAVTAGWYLVSANVAFAANGTGQRIAYLSVNGTERAATRVEHAVAGSAVPTCISTHADLVFLNAADYVDVWAIQTSTAALTVTAACLIAEWRSN